jgi:diguanylate cyclase (GGDEF)-like protein/PAS domain S-box-containing protein
LIGASGLNKSKTLFQQTYNNSFQEWVKTEQANADLIAVHRAMKDVALSRDDAQLQAALKDVDSYDAKIKVYFATMAKTDPNNPFLTDVINAYDDWAPIRAQTIAFAKNGQYDQAAENTRTTGADQENLVSNKMQLLINHEKANAEAAYKLSENTSDASISQLLWLALIATILAVIMSLYIRNKLRKYQTLLFAEKEKLQITLDSIGDGVITTDINRNVLSLNKIAEEFTGWKTQDAIGKPFTRVFDIKNVITGEKAKDPVEEVLATNAICLLENHTVLTSTDGIKRQIADSAAPIKDQNGKTSGVVMIFRDVTERKIAEKLLKTSEERFRAIFGQAPMGIGLSDFITGQIVELNERFAQIVGRTSEELRKMDWMSITHPDDLQEDLDQMALLNAQKITGYSMNKRYIKPDGSIVWIDMSIVPFKAMESVNPLRLCMIEDITQRKLSEAALKKSESRLKTAQSIADIGSWDIDLSTNRVWASEQAFKIYGIRQASSHLTLKAIQAVVCKEDRPMMDEALRLLLVKNGTYDVQFKINRVDDARQRNIHSIAVTEKDENGKPVKVLGTIQDITEIKNAEFELAQSNSLLKATLQSTADGILAVDLDGKISFYNEQFKKIWGLSDQILAQGDEKTVLQFIKDKLEDPESFFSKILNLNRQAESQTFYVIDLKDGRTIEIYTIPQWRDGAIVGHVLSFRDISERKHWERALIASEAKHKAVIANISDGIAIIDQNGLIKYNSPNLGSWFGWGQKDSLKSVIWAFVHPGDLERTQTEFRDLLKRDGLVKTVEYRHKCKDGNYMNILLTAVNMLHDANIKGVLMNLNDITESKKREEKILYLNYHDALTGLYNRAFFEEESKRLDNERQLPLSIIMGDINGLKLINDAFGHAEGDKLLTEIAKVLSSSCRSEDIVARTGGDEFCILLPKTSSGDAHIICRRIYKACENYEGETDKEMLYLSISLGYATKTDSGARIESILKDAEEHMYKQKLLESKSLHSSIISSIKTTMFEKSHETEEHEERLVALSKMVGQVLDLTDAQLNDLELLSTLHDIGKLSINDNILNKADKLTDEEWLEIRKHPEVGYRIAQASPELVPIADFILCHHERWDGKGYPQGLKGEAIPLLSRIVSVVDSFDAMTKDRPYRKAMPVAAAIDEITKNAGTQFDPEIARIFVEELLQSHG